MGIINKILLGKITLVISMITLGLVVYVLLFHNKFNKILLGDKWVFSGVGEKHGDDGWMRMLEQRKTVDADGNPIELEEGDDGEPKDYGDNGIAAGKFWSPNYHVAGGKIHLPANWKIGVEGTALVFRNGNTRYAMFPGKNVDL